MTIQLDIFVSVLSHDIDIPGHMFQYFYVISGLKRKVVVHLVDIGGIVFLITRFCCHIINCIFVPWHSNEMLEKTYSAIKKTIHRNW